MEQITKLDFPDDFKGYYAVSSYIGDGSLILVDDKGKFYYGDHTDGVEESTFEEFVEEWILGDMKEALKENNIEIPRLNTNSQQNQPILSQERFSEIMAQIKADKKSRP